VWIFFTLTACALIRLRGREPGLPRPYRVWGYPWTPLVFTGTALAMTINLWWTEPLHSSLGVVVILVGVLFYNGWRERTQGPIG
jgi:APA family basic amino acid/polyamine antiporter